MQGAVSVHRCAERLKSCDGAAASQAIDGRAAACTALAWHPFSEFLASCSPEPSGGPRLHDLRDGACLHSYKGHSAPVTHVRFAPDGRLLASADADGRVLVRPSRLGYCAVTARKTSPSRLGSCLDGSSQARPHSAQWLEADVCSGSGAWCPPAPRHAPHADGLAGQEVCARSRGAPAGAVRRGRRRCGTWSQAGCCTTLARGAPRPPAWRSTRARAWRSTRARAWRSTRARACWRPRRPMARSPCWAWSQPGPWTRWGPTRQARGGRPAPTQRLRSGLVMGACMGPAWELRRAALRAAASGVGAGRRRDRDRVCGRAATRC